MYRTIKKKFLEQGIGGTMLSLTIVAICIMMTVVQIFVQQHYAKYPELTFGNYRDVLGDNESITLTTIKKTLSPKKQEDNFAKDIKLLRQFALGEPSANRSPVSTEVDRVKDLAYQIATDTQTMVVLTPSQIVTSDTIDKIELSQRPIPLADRPRRDTQPIHSITFAYGTNIFVRDTPHAIASVSIAQVKKSAIEKRVFDTLAQVRVASAMPTLVLPTQKDTVLRESPAQALKRKRTLEKMLEREQKISLSNHRSEFFFPAGTDSSQMDSRHVKIRSIY